MPESLEVGGKKLPLDDDGFLQEWEAWDKEVAEALAKGDGIALTEEHWKVVNYLRNYFKTYKIAPPIRMLVKQCVDKEFPGKGGLKYVYVLFPGGPAKQACKYAGLPKPTGCV